jgi:radical SAM superfamily enzyme YgiQ (UPF0313 family)
MRIKLIYLPKLDIDYRAGEFNPRALYTPPIGISILTSFLRDNNIKVDQDDLFIKTRGKINLLPFSDENRIKQLVNNKCDDNLEPIGEKILKLTRTSGYDIFGFSIYDPDEPSSVGIALILAKILKERYEPTIIIGGHIPPQIKQTLLKSGLIDYSIHHSFESPAELNLLNFCNWYERGLNKKSVPGLEYLENGKLITNKSRYENEEVRKIIKPNFDGLPLELYKYKLAYRINGEYLKKKIFAVPYFFIKGCPYKCAFCVRSTDPFLSIKKVEEVVEDLKYLSEKYKTKYFFFLNSAVNPNYNYAENLSRALIKSDLSIMFSDCANFMNLDKKLLELLAEAGAVRLIFGLESASQKILEYIGKRLSLKKAETLLRYAEKVGIWSEIDAICGFPYERTSDVNLFINFIRKNRRYIKSIYLHKFFLDGKIRKYPEKYGIRIRKNEESKISTKMREGPFDELYGLKWEERIKLTHESFDKIRSEIRKLGIKEGTEFQELFLLRSLPEWNEIVKNGSFNVMQINN